MKGRVLRPVTPKIPSTISRSRPPRGIGNRQETLCDGHRLVLSVKADGSAGVRDDGSLQVVDQHIRQDAVGKRKRAAMAVQPESAVPCPS